MFDGDDPGGRLVGEDYMVGANRPHLAPVELAVGSGHHAHRSAVFRFKQMVPEASPSSGRGLGGVLFGLEGLVEAFPQMTRQVGEIGML